MYDSNDSGDCDGLHINLNHTCAFLGILKSNDFKTKDQFLLEEDNQHIFTANDHLNHALNTASVTN